MIEARLSAERLSTPGQWEPAVPTPRSTCAFCGAKLKRRNWREITSWVTCNEWQLPLIYGGLVGPDPEIAKREFEKEQQYLAAFIATYKRRENPDYVRTSWPGRKRQ